MSKLNRLYNAEKILYVIKSIRNGGIIYWMPLRVYSGLCVGSAKVSYIVYYCLNGTRHGGPSLLSRDRQLNIVRRLLNYIIHFDLNYLCLACIKCINGYFKTRHLKYLKSGRRNPGQLGMHWLSKVFDWKKYNLKLAPQFAQKSFSIWLAHPNFIFHLSSDSLSQFKDKFKVQFVVHF